MSNLAWLILQNQLTSYGGCRSWCSEPRDSNARLPSFIYLCWIAVCVFWPWIKVRLVWFSILKHLVTKTSHETRVMRASIWNHNSQVVNDNHSSSSRLSIHFNSLWISTRSQLDSVYLPHVFFLRFNWAIVSRYEIKSGPCVCSFVSGVWYSNRYRSIYMYIPRSRILAWQSENRTDLLRS